MARVSRIKTKVRVPKTNPYIGWLNVFEKAYFLASRKMLLRLARDLASRLRRNLRAQVFRWVPLSEKYKKYKLKHGLDPRMLIATGEYLNSIVVRQKLDGSVEVGIKNKIHTPSGLPLKKLMRIHEYGTQTIPARPWWRPTVAAFRKQIGQTRADLEKAQTKKVKAWLKSKKMI